MKATTHLLLCALSILIFSWVTESRAQSADPFEHGWILDSDASELRFLSIKKSVVAETSSFATLTGLITEEGKAQVRVLLDSVDTKVDLRNVRMRFLFFETFRHPEAVITAELAPDLLTDLHFARRKVITLPYTISLHGVTLQREEDVAVTLVSNDRVIVSTITPMAFKTEEFELEEGRKKLQDAANVDITPVGVVSFDFVFDRAKPGTPPAAIQQTAAPASAALETKGNMSTEACLGRFEILSRTGNIFFASGSTRLDDKSIPLLENLYDIVNRCPDFSVEIAGHTDSVGSNASNQRMSERRAASVRNWLRNRGIAGDRLTAVGYGETRPIVSNDTAENRARNRRIEFSASNN